jgi:hypothetical protein
MMACQISTNSECYLSSIIKTEQQQDECCICYCDK